MGAGAASAFLVGRLAQEGKQPDATLTASSGRLFGGVHVFAVADGRLWLAQPRLLGDPSLASVPLGEVGPARVLAGRRVEVVLTLGGREQRFTVEGGADVAVAFVAALGSSPEPPA